MYYFEFRNLTSICLQSFRILLLCNLVNLFSVYMFSYILLSVECAPNRAISCISEIFLSSRQSCMIDVCMRIHAHDLATRPGRMANLWRVTNDCTYLWGYGQDSTSSVRVCSSIRNSVRVLFMFMLGSIGCACSISVYSRCGSGKHILRMLYTMIIFCLDIFILNCQSSLRTCWLLMFHISQETDSDVQIAADELYEQLYGHLNQYFPINPLMPEFLFLWKLKNIIFIHVLHDI